MAAKLSLPSISCILLFPLLATAEDGVVWVCEHPKCAQSWPCPGSTQACKEQCNREYAQGYGFCQNDPSGSVCSCTYDC